MNSWRYFLLGMVRVSPLMLGVIPFGMICGATVVEAGLSPWNAIGMSIFVFAGASQLIVMQLMASEASWMVVLLTGIVINMRMLMYSASLSQYLGSEKLLMRMGIAYLMTDQAYASSVRYFQGESQNRDNEASFCNRPKGSVWVMFYFGAGWLMWSSFVVSTGIGAFAGAVIPEGLDLGFSVPLTFLALLMSSIRDRALQRAALVGAGIAVLSYGLPCNLGLLLGAASGIAAGYQLGGGTRSDEGAKKVV